MWKEVVSSPMAQPQCLVLGVQIRMRETTTANEDLSLTPNYFLPVLSLPLRLDFQKNQMSKCHVRLPTVYSAISVF
jgi:hypothetical protein